MIQDPVADWRELSALYEQADLLAGSALREWLAALPAETQKFVPRLERMLSARTRAAAEQFLESLPSLRDVSEPTPFAWDAGRRVGPYRLVRHVGSGGMAEVWLAERDDGAFARTVAIKLLHNHPTRAQRETFVERFRRERDILASLDHPNIAGLHDAGITAEGQPWLALEFVEGQTITDRCDRMRLQVEERVRLFRQVLLAVEHAHARLVIHRDVKPSNVLVTASGEVRLLDFGIAKLLGSEGDAHVATALTRQGGRPLTPQYASPEQLLGDPLTTACDVYSLGVVLYELLVGEAPYELVGKSLAELETAVMHVDPVAPSRRVFRADCLANRRTDAKGLRHELKPDLDAIVLRALEKSPARRYESVGAMRAELDRWLTHEPVLATLPGPGYRLGKFIRRHRAGVAVGTAVACLVIAAAGVVAWQGVRAQREASRALASKDFLLDIFRQSDPNITKGDSADAAALLDASLERANRQLVDHPELRAEVLRGIAEIDQHLDRYTKSREILMQVAEIYRGLGLRKEWTRTLVDLAENSTYAGDLEQADAFVIRALPGLNEFAADRALQARQHEVRGWLARKKGDLGDAKEHMQQALSSAVSAYGRKDSRTADALRGLAETEMATRDYEAARRYLAQARDVVLGSETTPPADVVGIELEQATVEFEAGQFARAAPLLAEASAQCERTLGPRNQDCFVSRFREALVSLKSWNFTSALESMPAFLNEAKNELSPARQIEANGIALRVLAANGRATEGVDLRDRLRRIVDAGAGAARFDGVHLSARLALAEADVREGDGAAGEGELAALFSDEAVAKVEGGYKARALMLRGLALQLQARHDEALRFLRDAEASYVDSFGPTHTETLLCRLNQIRSLVATRDRAQALALLDSTLPILRGRLPFGAPVIGALERVHRDLTVPAAGTSRTAWPAVFFN